MKYDKLLLNNMSIKNFGHHYSDLNEKAKKSLKLEYRAYINEVGLQQTYKTFPTKSDTRILGKRNL